MSVSPLTESQWQRRITDYCDWKKLKWHHETDSRKSPAGFPDLVIAGPGGFIFAELKVDGKTPTKKQWEWIDALTKAGANIYIWYPDEWPNVQRLLDALA